jgi:hypothetical protein
MTAPGAFGGRGLAFRGYVGRDPDRPDRVLVGFLVGGLTGNDSHVTPVGPEALA